ncbi:GNAT family N-acetyltransferase, partial [Pseudomonas aeruginosa]
RTLAAVLRRHLRIRSEIRWIPPTIDQLSGCGVGRMLVKHALSMAPELTTTVNEQNEQAVGFYKKVGFKVTGRSEVDDLGKPYPLLNLAYVGV